MTRQEELNYYKKMRDQLRARMKELRSMKMKRKHRDEFKNTRDAFNKAKVYIEYLETPEVMYPESYYKMHFDECRSWEFQCAKHFSEKYKVNSVLDIGCGVGSYMEGHLDAGVDTVKGLEYNYKTSIPHTPDTVKDFIEYCDATDPMDFAKYDCVWSVEVAEHIMPNRTEQFIHNLVNHTNKYILLTAAPPGQAGVGHINLRPKEFWLDSIKSHGFKYLRNDTERLQVNWKFLGAKWWVVRNVMLFERA